MKLLAKRAVTAVSVVVLVLVAGGLIVPALLGLQRYVIVGESMTGTIPKGSVVFSRLTPAADLRAGDIVTFVPPGETTPVTHRIQSIEDQGGQRVFRTKGDFNTATDPWRLTFPQPEQARYVYHIPYAGYALAALSIRPVRVLVISVPALLVAVSLLWSLWVSAGEDVRRREAEALPAESSDRP